jgi:predicted lactoylglutathione lyase
MKIKLVTFFPHPNFGTCLQSYALNKVLRDMGHDVEFIYNRNEIAPKLKGTDPLSLIKRTVKGTVKMILPEGVVKIIKRKKGELRDRRSTAAIQDVSEVLYTLDLPNKPLLKWLCKHKRFLDLYYKSTYSTPQEKKVFKFTFLDGNYKLRRLFTKGDYSRVSQDADMFITGSDQIWNPFCGGFNPMMFLEFAGDKKRIAYSSSISRPDFPTEIKDRVKKDLSKFQHIAVREQHSVELINDMLGRNDTKLVVDPTMLLSKEQWQSFADRANIEFEVPEKYIFCYFVGNRPEYIDMVNDVKQKTGIKDVITVDCIGNKTRYGDGIVYHDGGPYEWVYLLSHASMICMDSFHATVFALKFHKDFVHILKTKPSEGNANSSQNGRMYDILSRYGILYKLYNKENVNWLKPIDFDHIDKIMNEEIKDSLSYLKWEIEN